MKVAGKLNSFHEWDRPENATGRDRSRPVTSRFGMKRGLVIVDDYLLMTVPAFAAACHPAPSAGETLPATFIEGRANDPPREAEVAPDLEPVVSISAEPDQFTNRHPRVPCEAAGDPAVDLDYHVMTAWTCREMPHLDPPVGSSGHVPYANSYIWSTQGRVEANLRRRIPHENLGCEEGQGGYDHQALEHPFHGAPPCSSA